MFEIGITLDGITQSWHRHYPSPAAGHMFCIGITFTAVITSRRTIPSASPEKRCTGIPRRFLGSSIKCAKEHQEYSR